MRPRQRTRPRGQSHRHQRRRARRPRRTRATPPGRRIRARPPPHPRLKGLPMTTTEPRTFPITVPDGLWRIWSRAIHDAGMMLCVAPGHGVEVRPRHDPNRKLRGLTPGDLLSARELAVLRGMARGLAN